MDRLAVVRRRLYEQRLAGDPLATPAEAVGWLGAVQAQEFAEAKWSVSERVRDCTDADVERAFARGEILRTHVLRPTWHFVTRADIRWLLRLTAPRVHAANRYWYRRFELDESVLARSHEVLAAALAGGGPLTRPELAEALREGGVEAEGLRLGYVLMHAELEELVCSGPRRGSKQTYALFDERVGEEAKDLSRDEALAELVLRFFRSRGPATVADFTAWSSLTVADARAGLALAQGSLALEVDDGGTSWYAAAGLPQVRPPTGAFLLGEYDEAGIAYRDPRIVYAVAPPREGLMKRAIVIDGRAVGSWKRTLTRRAVVVEATLFAPLDSTARAALQTAAERFGRFLNLPVTLETTVVTG